MFVVMVMPRRSSVVSGTVVKLIADCQEAIQFAADYAHEIWANKAVINTESGVYVIGGDNGEPEVIFGLGKAHGIFVRLNREKEAEAVAA